MAGLGYIYELDLCNFEKNKHPIVYANKTYFYYRVGNNDLLSFNRVSLFENYESFKSHYIQSNGSVYSSLRQVRIYVPGGIKANFSFVAGFSHEELSLSEAEKKEQKIRLGIQRTEMEINSAKHFIQKHEQAIEDANKKLADKEADLKEREEKLKQLLERKNKLKNETE